MIPAHNYKATERVKYELQQSTQSQQKGQQENSSPSVSIFVLKIFFVS